MRIIELQHSSTAGAHLHTLVLTDTRTFPHIPSNILREIPLTLKKPKNPAKVALLRVSKPEFRGFIVLPISSSSRSQFPRTRRDDASTQAATVRSQHNRARTCFVRNMLSAGVSRVTPPP